MADGHDDPITTRSDEAEGPGNPSPSNSSRGGLWSRSFVALLVTQFLVAFNDNMFRWLIIPIGKAYIEPAKALQWGGVAFLVPFVLLAGVSGFFADRFSKRSVMVACKVAEIAIMVLGTFAILSGNVWAMFVVLFLMGAQSAFFSPSKYGSIPEMVRTEHISSANGWVGMTTFIAIIGGTAAGGILFDSTTLTGDGPGASSGPAMHGWWIWAFALIGVAVVGWIASLFIGPLAAAAPNRRFRDNVPGHCIPQVWELFSRRPLLWAALGSAFFWSLGVLAQLNVDNHATNPTVPNLVGDDGQFYVSLLLASLTLGIGIGCALAGIWSAGKIELGIVPFGAAGIVVMGIALSLLPEGVGTYQSAPYVWTAVFLFGLGLTAGLYDVPLLAFLQERSPSDCRGRILAAYNFIAFIGMMVTAVLFGVLAGQDGFGLSPRQIWLVAGLLTIPVLFAIVYLAFTPMIRVICRTVISTFYRVRVKGLENIPEEGGALLIANHVTWLDGVLLILFCPRPVRFIAHADFVETGVLGRLADL